MGPVIMKGSTATIGHASVPTTEIFVQDLFCDLDLASKVENFDLKSINQG
jgi:hypothetical protein